MLDRNPDAERQKRLMEGMRKAVERGAALTSQLLAFSRRQTLRPEAVDVAAQIGGMSELLERSLRENVSVITRFPEELWPVEVDPAQLELVVLNLAVNARDAMPHGGTVEIRGENVAGLHDESDLTGDFVRLSVSDTGIGMSPEILSHVFEPFFTTKDVGQGTGLGLAQVYGFARQSGGTVRIDSRRGEGTIVHLLLPRSHGAARPTPVRPSHRAQDAIAQGSVLLVEDDEAVRRLTQLTLQMQGYTVLPAADGAQALRLSEGHAGP